MPEVINLRQARKAKARADADLLAASNRAKFGRTKAERARQQRDAARAAAVLGGTKRQPES